MPYRDGGEFANVGILLHCAAIGYLKLKSGGQQITSRVRGFFPKIEEAVFRKGLGYMKKSINTASANTSMDFNVLAHSTEGMFFFSNIRFLYDERDPDAILQDLFNRYVLANYMKKPKGKEEAMTAIVHSWINEKEWGKKYTEKTYKDMYGYELAIPLVAEEAKAAKPLCFDVQQYREIIDKITLWDVRLARLRKEMPPEVFIIYKSPKNGTGRQDIEEFLRAAQVNYKISPIEANRKDEIIRKLEI